MALSGVASGAAIEQNQMVAAKAVFLDRDGVINRTEVRDGKPYAPRSLAEFEIFPEVPEACKKLADAGFLLFVVTNQPDIGNGLVERSVVNAMHTQLLAALPITKIYLCPHTQDAGCDCRKPKPGMLLKAKDEFGIRMAASFMVGDRYSDVQAGQAAGCNPIFIYKNYVETPDFTGTLRTEDLLTASAHIFTTDYNLTKG